MNYKLKWKEMNLALDDGSEITEGEAIPNPFAVPLTVSLGNCHRKLFASQLQPRRKLDVTSTRLPECPIPTSSITSPAHLIAEYSQEWA